MHWGVSREAGSVSKGPRDVVLKEKPGRKVNASGGTRQPASADARSVAISKRMAIKSTTDSLSTKDLQAMVLRMNLEQQYSNLKNNPTPGDKRDAGKQFTKEVLKKHGASLVAVGATGLVTKHPAMAGASALLKAAKVGKFLSENSNQKKKKK